MKLVFFCNYLNHHQVLVADALYHLLGEEYAFVATMPVETTLLKGAEDYSVSKKYCIRAYEGGHQYEIAMLMALEAEVCVFGADATSFAVERAIKVGSDNSKLSFEIAERWFKRGIVNIASPRLLKWFFTYHSCYKQAGFYRLCASAFTKKDDRILNAYKDKWYKWGYFTKVSDLGSKQFLFQNSKVRIMWCSRYLVWKHPEFAVMMAKLLKEKGYKFRLDMYGDEGSASKHDAVFSRDKLEKLIVDLDVADCIFLRGNKPNNEIVDAMHESSIFIFTSDKNEGWGAVANESMANGCVLVASDAIGSSPYLIKDGFNGFTFRSCDVGSLTEKVEWLLTHQDKMRQMQRNAYENMQLLWTPQVAAENLLTLIDCLKNNRETSIMEGPCSKA